MKKIIFASMAIACTVACSPLYNRIQSFDDEHFAQLQASIDKQTTKHQSEFVYTEASELNLIGKAFKTANPYVRIDTSDYKGFTALENRQCRSSAGLAVLFSTNSSTIKVKTEWGQLYDSFRSTAIAFRGYDLYIRDSKGEWQWAGASGTKCNEGNKDCIVIENMDGGWHDCLMYLPMYTEIHSCKIGIEKGSEIKTLDSPFRHKIVFHGSSYTQGISCSKSGMTYPLQFMRHTGLQIIPLGFGGNCKMQPYFCDVLCDIDADAYVFDSFSNPDYLEIKERLQGFIDRLIAAHPGKPLIFQQTIYREGRKFNTLEDATEQAKQDMATNIFDKLLKDPKYKDVYFIQTNASPAYNNEFSVDGIHPDDYGYYLWSKSIEKPILKILRQYGIK